MLDHAALAQREGDEHADRVQRDEIRDTARERDDETGGDEREQHDATRERETVASELEDARQETIARQDAREAREIGEGGVRGEHQQQRGRDLYEVVKRRAAADD